MIDLDREDLIYMVIEASSLTEEEIILIHNILQYGLIASILAVILGILMIIKAKNLFGKRYDAEENRHKTVAERQDEFIKSNRKGLGGFILSFFGWSFTVMGSLAVAVFVMIMRFVSF